MTDLILVFLMLTEGIGLSLYFYPNPTISIIGLVLGLIPLLPFLLFFLLYVILLIFWSIQRARRWFFPMFIKACESVFFIRVMFTSKAVRTYIKHSIHKSDFKRGIDKDISWLNDPIRTLDTQFKEKQIAILRKRQHELENLCVSIDEKKLLPEQVILLRKVLDF